MSHFQQFAQFFLSGARCHAKQTLLYVLNIALSTEWEQTVAAVKPLWGWKEEFSTLDPHKLLILFVINTVDKAYNCIKYTFQQEKKQETVLFSYKIPWTVEMIFQLVVAGALKP